MLTSSGRLQFDEAGGDRQKTSAYFWHGCLVFLSNPKALVFFGAFIPQFIDPSNETFAQVALLGATFMVVTTTLDSGYALAAGGARQWLSRSRVQLVERFSGCCMIAGGLWLALARR